VAVANTSIADYGAKGDGITDDTLPILAAYTSANATNRSLFVPATSAYYKANPKVAMNPKYAIQGPGTIKYKNALIYKEKVDFVGVPHNLDEKKYAYPVRLTDGFINPAPAGKPASTGGVEVIAHWYNDFGLEYTASSSNQANGSYQWYDWSWNYSGTADYDPSRHPLLGWYRGDDPNVLDWQCYWMGQIRHQRR